MSRDPRVNPMPGDVLTNRGVRREALRLVAFREGTAGVTSRFTSPRWKHTESAPIEAWRKRAATAEVIERAEDAATGRKE